MNGSYIKLYDINTKCDTAFLLNEGSVFFYASNADKYAINGKNLIIGSTEIIMNNLLNTKTERIEAAVTDKSSIIKKMPVEKFLEGLKSFSFSLNVSIVLAKHVLLTNKIINKNMSSINEEDLKIKEYSIEYYTIVDRIKQEFEKRKFPWLKTILSNYETSLTYKRGEAFHKSAEPVQLSITATISDKEIEYPKGATICEENTIGNEMYILKTGSLDVLINGNRVATIDNPGTVIGEMALLLGEKRSATLKAKNNVVITRIKKEDLKEVVQKQGDFLTTIVQSLAKRHYYNVIKIGSINKSIMDKSVDSEISGEKKVSPIHKMLKDLRGLKTAVEDAYTAKHADFLKDLVDAF